MTFLDIFLAQSFLGQYLCNFEYNIKFNGKYSETTNAVRNIIDYFLSFWSKKNILFFFYG